MGSLMSRRRVLVLGLILAVSMVPVAACSSAQPTTTGRAVTTGGAGTAASQKPALQLDEAKAVEKAIAAAEGGFIDLAPAGGDFVRISFPQGSLKANATLQAIPVLKAPIADAVLVPGFSLQDKATGKGPELQFPALLTMLVNKELPATTSLVRYKDDGSGYDVVATTVVTKDGATQLSAQVDGFSAYGAMGLTQKQIDEANAARKREARYNWVIYVKDKSDVPGAPVKQTVSVNLKASNTSGSMLGTYKGSATAKTTNDGAVGEGMLKATASSGSSDLTFDLGGALAPLTNDSDSDLPLAPLTKGGPEFIGSGTISMSTSGNAKVTGKGRTASGGFTNDSTVPIEVYVTGPLVRLAVMFPQGTVYFDGYIRGEGKK
jgi:hypothetical protein